MKHSQHGPGIALCFGLVALELVTLAAPPTPPYPKSTLIERVKLGSHRLHKADGDMWPSTWAADGNIYGAAGDNLGSPMTFWRIEGQPRGDWPYEVNVLLVDRMPLDPKIWCRGPNVDHLGGIKPAGLLSVDGVLYFAVENHNYGDKPAFNRQHNINGWIITSTDFGKSWKRDATPQYFFTGRLASAHFLQFGKDYAGGRDEFVYAYFPAADDGNSYWENGDYILLGRAPKNRLLDRSAWKFWTGLDGAGQPLWSTNDAKAKAVFRYPKMTG